MTRVIKKKTTNKQKVEAKVEQDKPYAIRLIQELAAKSLEYYSPAEGKTEFDPKDMFATPQGRVLAIAQTLISGHYKLTPKDLRSADIQDIPTYFLPDGYITREQALPIVGTLLCLIHRMSADANDAAAEACSVLKNIVNVFATAYKLSDEDCRNSIIAVTQLSEDPSEENK